MGGAETEVGARTTDVLIESAHFDALRVRRTARRLGLHSEASYRFERGVDRDGIAPRGRPRRAAARGAGGRQRRAGRGRGDRPRAARGRRDRARSRAREPAARHPASTALQIAALLARVDVAVADAGSGPLRCRVPSWRNDLRRDEDLVEEVARIHGYDRSPTTLPVAQLGPVAVSRGRSVARRRAQRAVRGGLRRVHDAAVRAAQRTSIASGLPEDDRASPRGAPAEPAHRTRSRSFGPRCVPSLLGVARTNRSRQVERVRVFEVGRVFAPVASDELPDETLHVAGVVMRGEGGLWAAPAQPPLFFDAKGIVERLLEELGLAASFAADANEPFLHPGASAAIALGDRRVGVVGELHPETRGALRDRRALRDLRARSRCDRGARRPRP